MKNGRENPRLSERLQVMKMATETRSMFDEANALMASQMEHFKRDYAILLKYVLDTTRADTEGLFETNRRLIVNTMDQIKTDLSLMRRLTKFGPWAAITSLICLVATIITPIWLWEKSVIAELRGNHLKEIGLVATPTETGQILSWDLTKLKLHECQQGAKAVPCLIRVGRP